jgi:hypothetical protein
MIYMKIYRTKRREKKIGRWRAKPSNSACENFPGKIPLLENYLPREWTRVSPHSTSYRT